MSKGIGIMDKKIKVNDIYEVVVSDLTSTGEGVAKVDGFTIFIDSAILGDRLKVKIYLVKKNYAKAKIIKMIESSSFRVENDHCSIGSELVKMAYQAALDWKKHHVTAVMKKIANVELDALAIFASKAKLYYRNKSSFPVRDGKIGVYHKNTHDIFELEYSPNNHRKIDEIMRLIRSKLKFVSTYNEQTHTGSLRHVVLRRSSLGDTMVVLVVNEDSNLNPVIQELIKFGVNTILINYNRKKTNVITGKEYKTIYGSGFINERIGDRFYKLGPDSFFQVNHDTMMNIYNRVRGFIEEIKPDVVYDLYSGMGTIASHISSGVRKIYAIEINEEAIQRGTLSAAQNGIDNITFIQGKSEDKIKEIEEKADVIIVDPPRKGLHEDLTKSIIDSNVKHIIYVSCKPSTLARDLKIFTEHDYTIKELECYDMFPNTTHVECIVLLQREI